MTGPPSAADPVSALISAGIAPTDIRRAVPLAPLTTLGVGGPASTLVRVSAESELVAAVSVCDSAHQPLFLLGGGSNVVVGDAGFDGTVVQVATRGLSDTRDGDDVRVVAAAGEGWDRVVAHAVENCWSGIEALSGIPGSVGATPIQNVGAYGREVAEVITSVTALDRRSRRCVTLAARECGFGYRSSRFKEEPGRWVILSVTLRLAADALSAPVLYADLADRLGIAVGERSASAQVRRAVLDVRRSKGMVLDAGDRDTWSVGSFFTNPTVPRQVADSLPSACPRWPVPPATSTGSSESVKLSAAWLISNAGFERGYPNVPDARAALSSKHSLAITNRGGASATDVITLARQVRDGVLAATGITLVAEPNFVNVAGL
ncbi:MAG: UDP-N-acetylmuramate dehydrogenase [Actinomycetes bacterium]